MKRLILTAILLSVAASGAPISGTLNVTGSIEISASFLDFSPTGEVEGLFNVADGSSGSFGVLTATPGLILDTESGAASVQNFITLLGAPGMQFNLLRIRSGIYAPALCAGGFVCTPAGSIYNVVATSHSTSSISFMMDFSVRSITGEITPYSALFAVPLADWTVADISELFAMDPSTTLGTYAFAAQFVPTRAGDDTLTVVTDPLLQPVPEPSTSILLLLGAVSALGMRRRSMIL